MSNCINTQYWSLPLALHRPAHAIHFAVYERAKELLGGNRGGYQVPATAAAGATATLAHDAIMTPVDVVKQRLQMAHSPYKGILDCVRRVFREEGIGALYRSYRWGSIAIC